MFTCFTSNPVAKAFECGVIKSRGEMPSDEGSQKHAVARVCDST